MRSNKSVKKLSLHGQEFDDDGLLLLLHAIKYNPDSVVEELIAQNFNNSNSRDMRGNHYFCNACGDKSFPAFINLMKTSKIIKCISISTNCTDSSTIHLIEEALVDNHTIVTFQCGIYNNNIFNTKILILLLKANSEYAGNANKDANELKCIKIKILATNREEGYIYPGVEALIEGGVGVQLLE